VGDSSWRWAPPQPGCMLVPIGHGFVLTWLPPKDLASSPELASFFSPTPEQTRPPQISPLSLSLSLSFKLSWSVRMIRSTTPCAGHSAHTSNPDSPCAVFLSHPSLPSKKYTLSFSCHLDHHLRHPPRTQRTRRVITNLSLAQHVLSSTSCACRNISHQRPRLFALQKS